MKYTLDEFLALPQSKQEEYWEDIEYFASEAHETWCDVAVEANTDTSIGSGRIPNTLVKCSCEAKKL